MTKKQRLLKYAQEISLKNYKSDLWLKEHFKDLITEEDEFNSPEGKYIPDLINRKYKYIIECDGSIHNEKHIKEIDKKKDEYYFRRGFKVFRIRHKDLASFQVIKNSIFNIKFGKNKTILRKKQNNA